MPTKTQVVNARPQILLDMVNGWKPFMATEETTAETYRGHVERPGGQPWEGTTADAATGVARNHHAAVADARDTVDEGVQSLVNTISTELIPPLTNAQQIIANAEAQPGVTVNEDLSITYTPPDGTSKETADRNRQTVADAAQELKDEADKWWTAEQLVQSQITTLRGKLDGTIPPDGAAPPGSPLTMVGPFAVPPEVAAAAQQQLPGQPAPGQNPTGQAPPGQVGPFPVPPAVAAAANGPGGAPITKLAGDDSGLGGLLGADDSLEGTPVAGQQGGLPASLGNVQPPMRPEDHPKPMPAALPRLDPAQVEAAKAQARPLLQQQGIPPDQIEQRLNEMVAAAQKPLEPHIPDPGEPGPRPSYSDGFGDAWRGLEDGAHDLVGYNGFENFKDAWKELGVGVVDTIKDPYGTLVGSIADEYNAAKANPEYWLGGKGFDVAAGAATLPFGAEGALAHGALDDVVGHGIPHEVFDGSGQHLPSAVDHPVVPAPDGFDHPMPIGPWQPETIDGIRQWLPEINHGPGMDAFDPARAVNCGQCALAVDQRLSGIMPDASAGLGTLSIPEMEAATGLRQVAATPSEIEQYLINQGAGAHTVVGVDRAGAPGHWFNAYYDGTKVYAVDGQTGQILGWPPDMDIPGRPVTGWDMGVPK